MKAVLQRVKYAEVKVDGKSVGNIQKGLLIFLGCIILLAIVVVVAAVVSSVSGAAAAIVDDEDSEES